MAIRFREYFEKNEAHIRAIDERRAAEQALHDGIAAFKKARAELVTLRTAVDTARQKEADTLTAADAAWLLRNMPDDAPIPADAKAEDWDDQTDDIDTSPDSDQRIGLTPAGAAAAAAE